MADSPGYNDSDECLFLDKEFLEMLNPKPPKAELESTLMEITGCFSEMTERYENLCSQYKSLKEKVKTASKENEKLKRDTANLKEETAVKEEELKKMNSRECKDSHRGECRLYFLITRIKWDMDRPEDEVAGVIGGKTGGTFQLDRNKHSKAFITNYLWNLIGNIE